MLPFSIWVMGGQPYASGKSPILLRVNIFESYCLIIINALKSGISGKKSGHQIFDRILDLISDRKFSPSLFIVSGSFNIYLT